MAKFTITWMQAMVHGGKKTEEIEAEHYTDEGDWIDFQEEDEAGKYRTKLRVRASEVRRIDRA